MQKREGAFAGTTKQLNRFIEDCLGKPEFQDRCESLQEFKQNIIKYHRTNEGIDKPIVGFEDLK